MADLDALLKLMNSIPRFEEELRPLPDPDGDEKSSDPMTAIERRVDSSNYADVYRETVDCIDESMSVLRNLNKMNKQTSRIQPAAAGIEPEPSNNDDAHVTDDSSEENFVEPDYIHYLKTYHVGYTSVAIIAHVSSCLGHAGVYLLDVNLGAHQEISLNVTECQRLTQTPSIGCVFGVHLDDDDGYVIRAVRAYSAFELTDEHGTAADPIAVYLIDTGETVTIDLAKTTLYTLSEQQQIVPAHAIPCRVIRVQQQTATTELAEFVLTHLYEKVRFEVAEIHKDNSIDVFLSSITYQHPPQQSTNPFLNMIAEPLQTTTSTTSDTALVRFQRDQLADTTGSDDAGTSNAMVAVTGYNPQDDARICRHYDPTTGGCFKGAHCRLEHVAILPDGWTRDQTTTTTQQCVAQQWPHIGQTVHLVPTYITNVNGFYAQIVDGCNGSGHHQLTELTRCMNNTTADRSTLRPFDQRPPNACDLVLALFRDGFWHRARVVEVMDVSAESVRLADIRLIVFLVDYGNCHHVRLDEVRQWERRFAYVPFQAYELRLANVDRVRTHFDARSIRLMRDMLINKRMVAKVLHNANVLVVTAQDSHGRDIGEQICAMGLAQPAIGAAHSTRYLGTMELIYPG